MQAKVWESFLPRIQARRTFDVDVVARGGSKDILHLHFKYAFFIFQWLQCL